MTGFASATRESAPGSVAIELKSVNHRYLEFTVRAPEELRALEPALREAITAKLTRGKVDCRLTFTPRSVGPKSLVPDAAAMESLRAASGKVIAAFPEARPLSVSEILHWPGVLADESFSPEALREEVLTILSRAISDLDQTRTREGAKLKVMIEERLDRMSELVIEAKPLVPGALKAFRDKLAAKVAEAAQSPSDERLQQEVVLYAARIDVDEELSRLGAHIAEVRRVLSKGGACGKRLDFLCQELNREANTLGSKAAANEMTAISVELKVLIEQVREQVQNVE
ncbi:YicC/YloC family endoribonuclease [Usitatibacter palustris]|nr:YicC/YloC family endoribonuclease [Usitatibacter palustris]